MFGEVISFLHPIKFSAARIYLQPRLQNILNPYRGGVKAAELNCEALLACFSARMEIGDGRAPVHNFVIIHVYKQ